MKVTKRDGSKEAFDYSKIYSAVDKAFKACDMTMPDPFKDVLEKTFKEDNPRTDKGKLIPLTVETIQDRIQTLLYEWDFRKVYDAYLLYRYEHKMTREYVKSQKDFIRKYMQSDNNANATVDDNSNVSCKNIGTLNVEAHKADNIKTSRGMIVDKLKELFPGFNHKQYIKDLEDHIIYKHDESSFAGPIAPYCVSGTMYPFLIDGIRGLGGLSASPHNLDSFCGIYINWIFAMSSQFAGAVASPEFFVCFDYYARKEWGDDYYLRTDEVITTPQVRRQMTIGKQIEQYFQQVVYSINQPTAARGMQSAFVNFAYFDKYFFEGMFGHFRFPDGTEVPWENIQWLQKTFMKWFNKERLRTVMTFPVESFALVYKDGKFLDEDAADFVAEEYAEGHSFFTYISDTVDSLSSCCFDKDTRIMYALPHSKHFERCVEIGEAYKKHKDHIVEVLGYNPYTNKRGWVKGRFVKAKSKELYKISFNRVNWTDIIATHDHLFPVNINGTYVDVNTKTLKAGDKLLADKAQWNISEEDYKEIIEVEIKSIEKIEREQDVYCLELLDSDSPYFVLSNGIITHNCRLKNKLQTKEFNFTNGNMGVMTGSKSVITININRIIQNTHRSGKIGNDFARWSREDFEGMKTEFETILERVYKYHIAYNESLWEMYDAGLLPVYSAGFIDLNKQYLTIGINGLNEAAEFLGLKISDNKDYQDFCQFIFSTIKDCNTTHNGMFNGHKLTFNTECVPAESLAAKNYNWDKADGYWVPEDRNLYASYIFLPSDPSVDIFEKIRMHGSRFIGDFLDGGSAAHINMDSHLSKVQYQKVLKYAAEEGCQYLTFNIPNSECKECHFITKVPIDKCPHCGSEHLWYYDRPIGYLTRIDHWSKPRQIEQKTRVYENTKEKV